MVCEEEVQSPCLCSILVLLHILCTICSSPKNRSRGSVDHGIAGTPLRTAAAISPGGNYIGAPFPGSNGAKRRTSISRPNGGGRGKGRGKKVGEMGYLGYGGDDGFEVLDSPMSTDGGDTHQQINGLNGEGMDEVCVSWGGEEV